MKDKEIYDEINSIRSLMERSTKFISLSGLAGIMAGIYALAAAAYAHTLLYPAGQTPDAAPNGDGVLTQLIVLAFVVLAASIGTGIWLSVRKAKRKGHKVWNPSSKALLVSGGIPLATGGLFIIIMLYQYNFAPIAAACLVFYGLALVAGSQHTFGDVKWLGIFEIVLGLTALWHPGYGLYLWTMGFGLLHILYGTIMHFKYDRENIVK